MPIRDLKAREFTSSLIPLRKTRSSTQRVSYNSPCASGSDLKHAKAQARTWGWPKFLALVLVRMLPDRQMEGMLWLVKDVSALLAWHDAFRKTTSVRKKVNAGKRCLSFSPAAKV